MLEAPAAPAAARTAAGRPGGTSPAGRGGAGLPAALPAKHIVIVSIQLGDAQSEDEFNAWYDDEHIRDFLALPGFLRVRRYKLLSNIQLVGKRETDEPVHTFWAIYDVDRDEFDKTPEFKATTRTPGAAKILSQIKAFNIRCFALHTSLPKPE